VVLHPVAPTVKTNMDSTANFAKTRHTRLDMVSPHTRDAEAMDAPSTVNTKEDTLTNAAITLTGVDTATSASVFNESRTVTLANGTLTDTFGAFAVHIYVVAK
jgi:hypothetical protein